MPILSIPKSRIWFPEKLSCNLQRVALSCGKIVQLRPFVVEVFQTVTDVKEVAWHADCPCWNVSQARHRLVIEAGHNRERRAIKYDGGLFAWVAGHLYPRRLIEENGGGPGARLRKLGASTDAR